MLFSARRPGFDLCWDLLRDPIPEWPKGSVVLHLAGALPDSNLDPNLNQAMMAPLLAACRANGVAHLLHASSAAVYGPKSEPAREDSALNPTSEYGRAKAQTEQLLRDGAEGLPFTILRIGNVVGADALLGAKSPQTSIALDHIEGSRSGPLRSWVAPIALARILGQLIDKQQDTGLPDCLNLAQHPPVSMDAMLLAAGRDWHWSGHPAAVPYAVADLSRLEALCPQEPITAADLIADQHRYRQWAGA